jgi:hypothetical protein
MYERLKALKRAIPDVQVKGLPRVDRGVIAKDEKDSAVNRLLVTGYGLSEVMGTDGESESLRPLRIRGIGADIMSRCGWTSHKDQSRHGDCRSPWHRGCAPDDLQRDPAHDEIARHVDRPSPRHVTRRRHVVQGRGAGYHPVRCAEDEGFGVDVGEFRKDDGSSGEC